MTRTAPAPFGREPFSKERAPVVRMPLRRSGDLPPLPAPLAADGSLPLPLALGAGLLVEPTLSELGVETGALNLTLEPPERALEALVVLDRHFQRGHTP